MLPPALLGLWIVALDRDVRSKVPQHRLGGSIMEGVHGTHDEVVCALCHVSVTVPSSRPLDRRRFTAADLSRRAIEKSPLKPLPPAEISEYRLCMTCMQSTDRAAATLGAAASTASSAYSP